MSHMEERTGQYRYVWTEECKKMPFSIEMAGIDKCSPKYYLHRNPAPISVVGYTLKGSGMIVQNGNKKKANAGSLFMVNTGEDHEYYPIEDWEFCWVNIRGVFWRELLEKYGLEQAVVFEKFARGQEFSEVLLKNSFCLWQAVYG